MNRSEISPIGPVVPSAAAPDAAAWQAQIRNKARLLHHQIASLQQLFAERPEGDAMLEQACAPYYELLQKLYTQEYPIARAIDTSDLLLHLDGPSVHETDPKLSLVTGVLSDVRKQVGYVVKVIAGAMHEALALPKEIDFGLASFAKGSLYLGFNLPDGSAAGLQAAYADALGMLGVATADMTQQAEPLQAYEAIQAHVPDPKCRDAVLAAAAHLAPSGKRGIDRVSLAGRCMPDGRWRVLSPAIRATVRQWLERPIAARETLEVTGLVREIDLDVRRIELRQLRDSAGRSLAEALGIKGPAADLLGLRCVYPPNFDAQAKDWLNSSLRVRGLAEIYNNQPRLLQIQEAELIST